MSEELPLASLFHEIFAFLATRDDAVLFGAMAVNAYCPTPRMTEDVDVLSTDAQGVAEALAAHLSARFRIALRVRSPVIGAFRVYQLRKPTNRHLVDLRQVTELPPANTVRGLRVVMPADLIAMKVRSIAARTGQEKGLSDRLDLHRMLNAFPELRTVDGPVADKLGHPHAALWAALVAERLSADDPDAW